MITPKYKVARSAKFSLDSQDIWQRIGCILTLVLVVTSCSPAPEDKMVPLLPNGVASLVIIYKEKTTNDQINYFLNNVLTDPKSEGHGLLPSISLRASEKIHGYDATVIAYRAQATQEQRDEVKRAAVGSPIVYKVLENVVPSQIKQIE